MADEENEKSPEVKKKGMGGAIKLAVLAAMILAALGGGLATWTLVLKDMLQPPAIEEVEVANLAEIDIPLNPVYLDLEDAFVQLLREEPDIPASLFTYTVSLECNNQATVDFINLRMPRFVNMINELHMDRTRAEVERGVDMKKSIERQALQKCNDMLRQMQREDVDEDIRVTAVLHTQWAVSE